MKTAMRYDCLDALRAVAMLWMTAYHFCYDLKYFGWIQQDFIRDPVWTWQRTCIVSLFLFCAGLSQAVALQQGQDGPRWSTAFWRRWRQVAGAALLVSAGSYLMYPTSFIYFGVLHGIAVMLILVRLTAGWGAWLWLLGAMAIAMKFIAIAVHSAWPELAFLNLKVWNWLGFIGTKPRTEDYVPLLPWLGVMWWGVAAGQWLLRQRPHWLAGVQGQGALQAVQSKLAVLGRYSLGYYLLHQPVLIGGMMLVKAAAG
jgi:uncharacterized membrane protein